MYQYSNVNKISLGTKREEWRISSPFGPCILSLDFVFDITILQGDMKTATSAGQNSKFVKL